MKNQDENVFSQYKAQYEQGMNPQTPEKKKGSGKSFWTGVITGLAAAVVISLGSLICTRLLMAPPGSGISISGKTTEQAETAGSSAVTKAVMEKMKKIEKVIDSYYYQEETDKEMLIEDAYKGMMASLGDPYSTYYTEEEVQELRDQTEGIYYGIGAYVSLDTKSGYAVISGVIAETPAEEAGLREGDVIYEVDGESAYGLELSDVVAMIKGEEGTLVHLKLVRDGESDYVEMDVERRRIVSPTVVSRMEEDQMGYIQITEFDDVTSGQFSEALQSLKDQGMKGLILDLRSNPGGNLTAVVEIAQMLLPEGMIVYTEDRDGNRDEYTCKGDQELKLPMVVLVNGYSASASEILAGAIQDYGTGTLVGTTTYGKGIVQQIISLRDGSAVKLTVSSYYTPKGRNIHGIGIEPDIVCEFDSDAYYASDEKPDNQLECAKEVLQEKMNP